MIVIVNYGVGNLSSIANMFRKIGAAATISSSIRTVSQAEKLVLPGVGSFDEGIKQLKELNLIKALNQKILVEKTPILGICLGMQLFANGSEEGSLEGLGWINARTKRFDFDSNQRLRVPHMGWNRVYQQKQSPLFKDMFDKPRFYFAHSYHVVCNYKMDVLTTTYYGFDFTSAIQRNNIHGVQFHPEKSHKFGMKLLKNFCEL